MWECLLQLHDPAPLTNTIRDGDSAGTTGNSDEDRKGVELVDPAPFLFSAPFPRSYAAVTV